MSSSGTRNAVNDDDDEYYTIRYQILGIRYQVLGNHHAAYLFKIMGIYLIKEY